MLHRDPRHAGRFPRKVLGIDPYLLAVTRGRVLDRSAIEPAMQGFRAVLLAAVGPDADAALELDTRRLHLPLATPTFFSAVEWTSARPRELQDDRAARPMLRLGTVVDALAEV